MVGDQSGWYLPRGAVVSQSSFGSLVVEIARAPEVSGKGRPMPSHILGSLPGSYGSSPSTPVLGFREMGAVWGSTIPLGHMVTCSQVPWRMGKGSHDPSKTGAVRLPCSETRHRMRANRHLASVGVVRSLNTMNFCTCGTLVTWFQLGEFRLWAMGLTSESGRWPDPLPMVKLGFGGGSKTNRNRDPRQ